MDAHSLSIVFGPTLFQADGTDKSHGQVVEDLVRHYQTIFDVSARVSKGRRRPSRFGKRNPSFCLFSPRRSTRSSLKGRLT